MTGNNDLLERLKRAQQLVEEIGLDVSLSGEDALDELQTILCDMRSAHAAQAEEVALLREWYAADLESSAAEAELFRSPREPGEIRSNGAFGQAQRRKWAAEEAIRAALKGASNEP